MSTLRQALTDYLALRHAMGFKRHDAHRVLSQFVDFLTCQGATFITTEWALCWATQPRHVQPAEWARRLRLVRGFAQYHYALDPHRPYRTVAVTGPHLGAEQALRISLFTIGTGTMPGKWPVLWRL